MNYLSQLTVKKNAPLNRVQLLVGELKSFDCCVRFNRHEYQLEFEVSDRDLAWICSGGLHKLLNSYADVVSWSSDFQEKKVAFYFSHQPSLPPSQRIKA